MWLPRAVLINSENVALSSADLSGFVLDVPAHMTGPPRTTLGWGSPLENVPSAQGGICVGNLLAKESELSGPGPQTCFSFLAAHAPSLGLR